jgi:hypothetical protein
MVHRIHRNTADLWPTSQPATSSRLTEIVLFVIQIADLTNGGHTIKKNHADFSRRQLDLGVFTFFGHELTIGARTPNDLAPRSNL